MPLTFEQVKTLEARKSRYGCGRETCLACYPVQYACDWCQERFSAPILTGEFYVCESCGFDLEEWDKC